MKENIKKKNIFKMIPAPYKKYIWIALGILVVGLTLMIIFISLHEHRVEITTREARIKDIKAVAQLSSIEIYNDVPIVDTINNKVMFAMQKQKGSIAFDLEKIIIDSDGDTVKIILSPEIVNLYESTEPKSWEVLDSKAIGWNRMFRSDEITDKEESILKGKIKDRAIKQLYSSGVIERARSEGALTLQGFMELIYRKPVRIIDPTPKGSDYDKYINSSK